MNASPATSLLATKLHLPIPRTTAVARPRLIERFLTGLRARLTLVAAPAGSGKSTLLAQALAEARGLSGANQAAAHSVTPRASGVAYQIGWVALDPGDNDPARFWSYVSTALEQASPGLGAATMAVLRIETSVVEAAITELLNSLATHDEHVVLVLDDYHTITNPAIHDGVSFLLDHAPPHFHLVIASRSDPLLPLARWRARGELVEIRAAGLRFTTEEAIQFFSETMGLHLDARAVGLLEERTEGWAAGLQLAALSLQGHHDARSFIDTFSGSHRHVVDYLAEEVLNHQPAHIRTFLLQTSILARMCAELCEVVMHGDATTPADPSAATILAELDRQNLFLIPLDDERRWYRYHHLFADLLRHRLAQEQPTAVRELHRRAALWFEQRETIAEAVEHALAAADTDLVVRLLSTHGMRFAAQGETRTLQHWLDALPHEHLLSNPQLCLAQAWVLMLDRRVAAVDPYLQAAEPLLAAEDGSEAVGLRGELLALRAHVAVERGAFQDALTLARRALTLLPATERWARSSSMLMLGYALYVLGETSEAITVHVENVSLARSAGNVVSALFSATEVVKLQVLQGHLSEARASVEQALAWAADEGWQQLSPVSALHTWLGRVLMEIGDLSSAKVRLERAVHLSRHGPAITAARSQIFLARLCELMGERDAANAAVATVERICRDWEASGERSFFAAYIARVRLQQGNVEVARTWARQQTPWDPNERPSYFREIELLTLARVAVLSESEPIREAEMAQILALLAWLRDQAITGERGGVVLETLALEALALNRAGREGQAQERLDEALAYGAPEGVVSLFVDLGAPMVGLLARNLARREPTDPLQPYLTQLMRAFARGQAEPPSPVPSTPSRPALSPATLEGEAMTKREMEVLHLLAAGLSGPEIAEHFVVSINTVKSQIKSIYSKLDAHNRDEALEKARAYHLLP